MTSAPTDPPILTTPRLLLRPASPAHGPALLDYYCANRSHLQPWEPARPASFYTLDAMAQRLAAMQAQNAAGQALHCLLFEHNHDSVIGDCNATNIVRGVFQACHLGFSLARPYEGQGLMRECLTTVIAHLFNDLGLHRIMANYRPENQRSARLLRSLGFEQEGLARAYLKINGVWTDHVLTSLIHPEER